MEKTPNLHKLLQLPQRTRVNCTKGCNRLFPKLIPFQILSFLLDLKKFINNLFIRPLKSTLALVTFEVSLKVAMFGLVFMKFAKLKSLHQEKKELGPRKT